jgi:hypothetical protein
VSAAVHVPVMHAETIHNNRVLMAVYAVLAVAGWAASACFVVTGIYLLIPLHSLGFMRLLGAIEWIGGGYCMIFTGQLLWNLGPKKWHNRVVLDADGVHIFCTMKDARKDWYARWEHITNVICQSGGGYQTFKVKTVDGYFEYNSYTFTTPKKIALRIAAACGTLIEYSK